MSTNPNERGAWLWMALSALGLAGAALIIPSCAQGGVTPTPMASVTSRSPASGSSSVSRTAIVTVEFNSQILGTSLTPSTFTLTGPSGLVPATVGFQPCNRVAVLTPNAPLAPNTTFTVALTTGIADPSGRSINPESFDFTTVASADVTPPLFGGASTVTSPDVPTATSPGSPNTIIPSAPVTTIPPTTIPTGPGTSVTIPGTSVTTPVTNSPVPSVVPTPGPTGVTPGPGGTAGAALGSGAAGTTPGASSTVATPGAGTATGSGIVVGTGTGGVNSGTETSTTQLFATSATRLFAVSTLRATVTWSPASDDQDPASAIVYDVFVSTMPNCFNFGAPTLTTSPGDTSATISNLVLGVPYFFVVRARDTSGNEDRNLHMLSLLPASPPTISFSNDVWPIIQARCQNCHTVGVGAQQVPDMLLSSQADTLAAWVNIRASCPLLSLGTLRVSPGHSLTSFVWQKISMDVPPCGARMPLDAPPLSTLEQQTIQTWIDQGAPNN